MNRLPIALLSLLFAATLAPACSDDSGDSKKDTTTDVAADSGADAGSSDDSGASGSADAGTSGSKDTGSTGAKDAGSTGPVDAGKKPPSKHNSFATALPLTVGADATDEELAPTGEVDYFTFEGKKGDAILIDIFAQDKPFEKTAIDTVITLFDKDEKQVAENDDPTPRTTNDSAIFTILPADGTYYVTVQECSTWVAAKKLNASCAEPKDKTTTKYKIFVGKLNPQATHVVEDGEKGNTPADFTAGGYTKINNPQVSAYTTTRIYGTFKDNKDADYFRFVPPTDVSAAKDTHLTVSFDPHPAGKDGSGSTTDIGVATVALASAPTAIVAKANLTYKGAEIQVPVKPGEPLIFGVQHPGTGAGSNDFYFVSHRVSGDNPLEKKDKENNDAKTAEPLTQQQTTAGVPGFFIAGSIGNDGKDVDHYVMTVASGFEKGKITANCAAQRSGSGLRGMTIKLLKGDGTEYPGAKWVEDETANAQVKDIPVGGESKFILQISAKSQAKDVSSNFYRCGIYIFDK